VGGVYPGTPCDFKKNPVETEDFSDFSAICAGREVKFSTLRQTANQSEPRRIIRPAGPSSADTFEKSGLPELGDFFEPETSRIG